MQQTGTASSCQHLCLCRDAVAGSTWLLAAYLFLESCKAAILLAIVSLLGQLVGSPPCLLLAQLLDQVLQLRCTLLETAKAKAVRQSWQEPLAKNQARIVVLANLGQQPETVLDNRTLQCRAAGKIFHQVLQLGMRRAEKQSCWAGALAKQE